MKRVAVSSALALTVLLLGAAATAPTAYKIDPVHSSALYKVNHLGVSNSYGFFPDISGTVTFAADALDASSIEVKVNAASVHSFSEARDKHLSTADFFDVEKHPLMSFKSSKWEKKEGQVYTVTGDFTMLGTTKPVTVEATLIGTGKGRKGEALIGFESTFQIKRSDYGMGGMVPAIGDEVDITVSIEAAAQP